MVPMLIQEVDELLRKRFASGETAFVPTDARIIPNERETRAEQLMRPDSERSKMPLTQDKYQVHENPELVAWERETRKFLRQLSPSHGHRVSASMVFEWATGIPVKELMEQGGSTTDLKRINQLLRFYYGKPYQTYICGRKVPQAYRVPPGSYIRRRRPMTLTLYLEYLEKTLYP